MIKNNLQIIFDLNKIEKKYVHLIDRFIVDDVNIKKYSLDELEEEFIEYIDSIIN